MRPLPRAAAAVVVVFVIAGIVGTLTVTAASDDTAPGAGAADGVAPAGGPAAPDPTPPVDAEDVLAHAAALHDLTRAAEAQRRAEEAAALEALARAEAERQAALPAPDPTRGDVPDDSYWDAMARCETGGDWGMTGSRYSGGVGFYNGTWDAWGGREFAPLAGQATREEQIVVANRIATQGWTRPGGGYVAPVGYSGWGCTSSVGYP